MVEVLPIIASEKVPPKPSPPGQEEVAPSGVAPVLTFQHVYEAHVDFVWRMVGRLGVRDAATEDVVQDVFLVVHRRLVEFEGRSSVRTWLVGILRRVLFERRRSTRRKLPPAFAEGAPTDVDALADGTAKRPDERAAHAEAVRLLYELLDELDEDKREVFILVQLEQLPVAEIAEALGMNVNTVYSRLRLAREKFDSALARHRARDGWRFR